LLTCWIAAAHLSMALVLLRVLCFSGAVFLNSLVYK
jgi:hypothetical protein